MDFGSFSPDGREYIIRKYDIPRPWINYLCNGDFCSLISQTGGGYSFYKDPKDLRLTKYRYTNVLIDRPGKYVYIRDNAREQYWSLGWQPVMATPTFFECRHGLGYTVISSETDRIFSSSTFFVPAGDDCEIWDVKLRNNDTKARDLTLFFYVEFSHFNAVDELLFYANKKYFSDAYWDDRNQVVLHHEHFNWLPIGKVFFGLTNQKADGYDCVRQSFIGNYRDETNPEAVEKGRCTNSTLVGGDGMGAVSCRVLLQPGEEKSLIAILGVDMRREDTVPRLREKYSSPATAARELERVKEGWETYLARLVVKTPDADSDSMLNVWHQYQCKTTFDWSRFASSYNTGTGRGIGFRDTCQDTIGVSHAIPEKVREKLLLLGSNMYEDGHSYHLFFPISKTGDPKKYGDDHLWYTLAVDSYIRETGDWSIVDAKIPYIEGSEGTVFDHMRRSVDYAIKNSGPHGLPLMFFADWNDCLNNICLRGKGESVMVAMQVVLTAAQLVEIARRTGREKEIPALEEIGRRMKETINRVAWDGAWYVRAFTDDGNKIGSKDCAEGNIYIETQVWAVLSGVADEARARQCMDSVYTQLNSDCGIKLLNPPYTQFPLDVGSLIHYPAGLKENASIFCHTNTWAIIAEAMLKRSDRAYEYYRKLLPPRIAAQVGHEKYGVEPYCYTQFIFGPDHKDFGTASHSWLTGTAAWSLRAVTDYILGVRPEFDGLRVDPCMPAAWKEFEMTRVFRGVSYRIQVENRSGKGHGVKSIEVDGRKVDGVCVPVQKKNCTVRVVL